MDKIHEISILVLLNWMGKRMIGVRQLPAVLQVGANAVLDSLSWSCWIICKDSPNVLQMIFSVYYHDLF